jgi:hypothetical protein
MDGRLAFDKKDEGFVWFLLICLVVGGVLLGHFAWTSSCPLDVKILPQHQSYLCTDHFVSAYYNCAKPYENRTGEYCEGRIVCENLW